MSKQEIQNLFNLNDMDQLAQSLTPVKDKVFNQTANA